jgi:ribosomal protein S18 acetylase RimI-like enzyme
MRIVHGYKRDEVDRLVQINDECFEGLQRPPEKDFKAMLSVSETWIARLEGDAVILSDENQGIVGFIIINREYGSYVWSMAVDPEYQARGIGGNLLRKAMLWCREQGDKEMRLHVHVDNPAQMLYFNYGFRVCNIAWGYYGEGAEGRGLLMKKKL